MTTTTDYPATDRQKNYIRSLINDRDTTAIEAKGTSKQEILAQVNGLSKRNASRWIERLKELPFGNKAGELVEDIRDLAPKVPAGRYAVTGADGTTDFYRVDKPTKGKWQGYTFVQLGLGGGYGEPNWERTSRKVTASILAKIIEAGPEAASKRYGKELGHCGCCGRTLTNPDSIERGIGPVCAGKNEWVF
jgi:hypothetical protein